MVGSPNAVLETYGSGDTEAALRRALDARGPAPARARSAARPTTRRSSAPGSRSAACSPGASERVGAAEARRFGATRRAAGRPVLPPRVRHARERRPRRWSSGWPTRSRRRCARWPAEPRRARGLSGSRSRRGPRARPRSTSTRSTARRAGPRGRTPPSPRPRPGAPSNSASTVPSRRLRTQPLTPRDSARPARRCRGRTPPARCRGRRRGARPLAHARIVTRGRASRCAQPRLARGGRTSTYGIPRPMCGICSPSRFRSAL